MRDLAHPRACSLATRDRTRPLSYVATKGTRFAQRDFVGASWRSKTRVFSFLRGRVWGGPRDDFLFARLALYRAALLENSRRFFWLHVFITIQYASLPGGIGIACGTIERQGPEALPPESTLAVLADACEFRKTL